MADYRFDKPWAAESQNVQDFTEEEWGTGIVEKSLVSSSQVNGVMQAVTRRFLDLEAVEDRQYRYDFVVENKADWNKLINDNLGNAQSVLIRKGQVWTATNAVTLRRVGVIALEEGAEVRFNGGLNRQPLSPAILSGGVIRGDLTNCRVLYATVTNTINTTYDNTAFENSYVYTESASVTLSGGLYCRSVLNLQGKLSNAKLADCKITDVSKLDNCTLVRCVIPDNTKLTNCTVIDCDYSVTRYIKNLVTGTTFRNCNINIDINNSVYGVVISSDTIFRCCKLSIDVANISNINGNVYDCEFLGGDGSLAMATNFRIYGNSFIILSVNISEIASKFNNAVIQTDTPFYRDISEYRYYVYEVERTSGLIPGAINSIPDSRKRNLKTNTTGNSYFVRFKTGIAAGVTMDFGGVIITPTEQLNIEGYTKLTL